MKTSHVLSVLCLSVAVLMPASGLANCMDDINAGHNLFVKKGCVTCHGIHGDGRGPAAAFLGVDIPDFTDAKVMSSIPNRSLIDHMSGPAFFPPGTRMCVPASKPFTDQELKQLLWYVRALEVDTE